MEDSYIRIGHGSGGRLTQELIREIFIEHFTNPILEQQADAALLSLHEKNLAFTTDTYVIDPIFFPGGDIGKLSISGTVNDLCVTGAIPKFISAGFIIEEGFAIEQLIKIVESMAREAKRSGVEIVTGDTKVVKKGQCDKIFINTSGIGYLDPDRVSLSTRSLIKNGDKVIVTGTLGDHSIAVLSAREHLTLEQNIISDAAPLNMLVESILKEPGTVHFMRDITRGGLATVLNETCEKMNFGIEIDEKMIPVQRSIQAVCDLYGFDPVYLANEGKLMIIAGKSSANKILNIIRQDKHGKNAAIIGEIVNSNPGIVVMKTQIGGKRIIDMLTGEMLPRIC